MSQVIIEKNEIIDVVKQILKDELEICDIKDNDNFFELGGDSLSAIIIICKIEKFFQVEFKVPFLYKYPTPVGMSECIYRMITGEVVSYGGD